MRPLRRSTEAVHPKSCAFGNRARQFRALGSSFWHRSELHRRFFAICFGRRELPPGTAWLKALYCIDEATAWWGIHPQRVVAWFCKKSSTDWRLSSFDVPKRKRGFQRKIAPSILIFGLTEIPSVPLSQSFCTCKRVLPQTSCLCSWGF